MTSGIADIGAPYEAQLLADWLTDGKPELGWRGDPRLELHIGVAEAAKNGYRGTKFFRKGDVVGMRFEVRRHNEDGTDTIVLARPVGQWEEIIPKLVQMDPRTPGHENVMDVVEREHNQNEKDKSTEFRETWGEMTEHLWHATGQLPKKVGFSDAGQ